jgi:hypothetical protein
LPITYFTWHQYSVVSTGRTVSWCSLSPQRYTVSLVSLICVVPYKCSIPQAYTWSVFACSRNFSLSSFTSQVSAGVRITDIPLQSIGALMEILVVGTGSSAGSPGGGWVKWHQQLRGIVRAFVTTCTKTAILWRIHHPSSLTIQLGQRVSIHLLYGCLPSSVNAHAVATNGANTGTVQVV